MNRFVVLVPLALVVLTAVAIFVGRRLKDAAVVVENAPAAAFLDQPRRFVGRAVVAGSDLDWQLDLQRFYRDYDAYRVEHRLPGESR